MKKMVFICAIAGGCDDGAGWEFSSRRAGHARSALAARAFNTSFRISHDFTVTASGQKSYTLCEEGGVFRMRR
jgi:hypothetical protein